MKKLLNIVIFLSIVHPYSSFAQENMEDLLDENKTTSTKEYVTASFKGTRLINLHTIETLRKGSLDFRISHRFGEFSSGANNFWGLDGPADIRLGFDYSITDNLTIGIGRTSYDKMVDGFLKYKILKQTTNNSMPLSMTGVVSMNVIGLKNGRTASSGVNQFDNFTQRIAYFYQLMIARKFNEKLTLQLNPMVVHYNLVQNFTDKNNSYFVGFSGRYKLTHRFAVTGEYCMNILKYSANMSNYTNSASIGLDIETGGHVFQLFVTNSQGINEVQLLPYTMSSWSKGQIRFGFNVSRVFSLYRDKKGSDY